MMPESTREFGSVRPLFETRGRSIPSSYCGGIKRPKGVKDLPHLGLFKLLQLPSGDRYLDS